MYKKPEPVIRIPLQSDLKQICKVQTICFPNNILSFLGTRGLESYYRFFISEPLSIFFVLEHKDEIIGFVVGWQSGTTYRSQIIIKKAPHLLLAIIKATLLHPKQAWGFIKPRIRFLSTLGLNWVKFFPKFGNRKNDTESTEPLIASLLSIGVIPKFTGTGLASRLLNAFLNECKSRHVQEIWLTIGRDNLRARHHYEKQGWSLLNNQNHQLNSTVDYKYDIS